jgi:hypothetical protein
MWYRAAEGVGLVVVVLSRHYTVLHLLSQMKLGWTACTSGWPVMRMTVDSEGKNSMRQKFRFSHK